MYIQGLGTTYQAATKPAAPLRDRSAKQGGAASHTLFSPVSDTYESSQDPAERKQLMQEIRNKIRSGFYNTEPVIEDLSHGFAKILNPMQ